MPRNFFVNFNDFIYKIFCKNLKTPFLKFTMTIARFEFSRLAALQKRGFKS